MAPEWDVEGVSYNLGGYNVHKFRISSKTPPPTKKPILVSTRTYQTVETGMNWGIIEREYKYNVTDCVVPSSASGLVLILKVIRVETSTEQSQPDAPK